MMSAAQFNSLEGLLRWGVSDAAQQDEWMRVLDAQPSLALNVDEDGNTLLMVAANAGNLEAVRLLCTHGANTKALSLAGENALTAVVMGARDDASQAWCAIAAELMAHGADPNQIAYQGCSALHWAVIHALPALVQTLLAGGGDPAIRLRDPPDSDNLFELVASSRFRGNAQQRAEIASLLASGEAP